MERYGAVELARVAVELARVAAPILGALLTDPRREDTTVREEVEYSVDLAQSLLVRCHEAVAEVEKT